MTLVEFADLQCPFCKEFADNVTPRLIQDYVRTKKLRIQFQPLTFIGPDSEKAARYAIGSGGQNKLWNFVELFYRNQGTENTGYVTDEFVHKIGCSGRGQSGPGRHHGHLRGHDDRAGQGQPPGPAQRDQLDALLPDRKDRRDAREVRPLGARPEGLHRADRPGPGRAVAGGGAEPGAQAEICRTFRGAGPQRPGSPLLASERR